MFKRMQGVTTALVAFIFFCVIFPERIKSRPQFYAAFGLICLIILLDALGFMLANYSFKVFVYFATAVLQVGSICLLFLAAGGITWRDLGGELSNAFEVIRRGGDEKEVIIPLSGATPKKKDAYADDVGDDEPPERIVLDEPGQATPPPPRPPEPRGGSNPSIPLE
jgi:hypothetical protein